MMKNRLITFAAALCIGLTALVTISSIVITAEEDSEYTITDEIHGVNDSVFYIARPDESSLTVINASRFGLSAQSPIFGLYILKNGKKCGIMSEALTGVQFRI